MSKLVSDEKWREHVKTINIYNLSNVTTTYSVNQFPVFINGEILRIEVFKVCDDVLGMCLRHYPDYTLKLFESHGYDKSWLYANRDFVIASYIGGVCWFSVYTRVLFGVKCVKFDNAGPYGRYTLEVFEKEEFKEDALE